jgi:hypothetical protein
VLSLYIATGVDIESCNNYLKKYGRRNRKGMLRHDIETAFKGMKKFYFKKGNYSPSNRITINKFLDTHTKGTYYCLSRGHAFIIKDGVLYDYKEGLKRQIQHVWRVYTIEEIERFKTNEN